MDALMDEITFTGSLARDHEKWGIAADDEDNLEFLQEYISAKLPWLDEYLAQKAQPKQ